MTTTGASRRLSSHLRELARPVVRRRAARPERVSPALARLLDTWPATPALIVGRRLDVLANNRLAGAVNHCSVRGANQVRVAFLDPEARRIFADWPTVAAGHGGQPGRRGRCRP